MLLELDRFGLGCPAGGFYIDPRKAVDRALITHAHADHARKGSRRYLCAAPGKGLLQHRLGAKASIESVPYCRTVDLNGVHVSFHPSGHILGAAQIRVEYRGEVWVVSGDYKLEADPTCASFEPIPCHTFLSECTFGLPIYRWPDPASVHREINEWWATNRQRRRHSFLYGYSLGKAQRLLTGLDPSVGPIYVHSAVYDLIPFYREQGVPLPEVYRVGRDLLQAEKRGAMVVLPPGASSAKYTRGVGEIESGFASGWMLVKAGRRAMNDRRGFVLSDHVDWPGLNEAVRASGAERILLDHGDTEPMVRWLREQGRDAATLSVTGSGKEESLA